MRFPLRPARMQSSRAPARSLIMATLALPLLAPMSNAAFIEDVVPDARDRGLGHAFVAIAEGPTATSWNPAALGLSEPISIMPFASAELYSPLSPDLEVVTYGGTGRWRDIGIGVHYSRFSYGEVTLWPNEEAGVYEPTESVFGIGGGFAHVYSGGRATLAAGSTLKRIEMDFAPAGRASVWDLDLGGLCSYRFPLGGAQTASQSVGSVEVRGAAVLSNALGRELSYEDDGSEELTRRLKLGAAAIVSLYSLPPFAHVLEGTAVVERVSFHGGAEADRPADEYFGIEGSVLGIFAIRTGYVHEGEEPMYDRRGWTWGYGLGCDFELDGAVSRIGGRFDVAKDSLSKHARDLDQYSLTFWFAF